MCSFQPVNIACSPEELSHIQQSFSISHPVTVISCSAKKPNYEIGASTQLKLSFNKKPADGNY